MTPDEEFDEMLRNSSLGSPSAEYIYRQAEELLIRLCEQKIRRYLILKETEEEDGREIGRRAGD